MRVVEKSDGDRRTIRGVVGGGGVGVGEGGF